MRIGELARRTGVPAKTIRYYEGLDLIGEPPREASGYRRYDEDAVSRLRFIAGAKQLGLTLEEIGDILGASDQREVSCPHVVALLEAKRDRVEDWIRSARALVDVLNATIESSRELMTTRSASADCCSVIEHGLHERALMVAEDPEREPQAMIPFSEPAARASKSVRSRSRAASGQPGR